MIARLLFLIAALGAWPALAQQNVHVPVEQGGRTLQLAAQLFKPAAATASPAPAVAIFPGCGGPGQNTSRMAGLLASWGYVALVVDSYSARGLKDVLRPQLAHPGGCRRAGIRHRRGPRLARQAALRRCQAAGLHGLFVRRRRRGAARTLAASRRHDARNGTSTGTGAGGDPGLSGLRAGRCAGPQARGAPADLLRHGRARRLDAGAEMYGGDRPRGAGPRPWSRRASTTAPITASTRSACRCVISPTSATAASRAAAAARTTAPTRRRGRRSSST